jgi:hypothetical protein
MADWPSLPMRILTLETSAVEMEGRSVLELQQRKRTDDDNSEISDYVAYEVSRICAKMLPNQVPAVPTKCHTRTMDSHFFYLRADSFIHLLPLQRYT